MSNIITISIDEETAKIIDELRKRGENISKLVREALYEVYLKKVLGRDEKDDKQKEQDDKLR